MPRIVQQPDIVQTILELQKRVSKLENGPRLTASNIQTNGNSRLSVSNVSGQVVFEAGDLATSTPGVNASGMAAYRPDGTAALIGVSSPLGRQYGLVDHTNLVVVQTNENSGFGLEDPSIPIILYPNANIPSTTSLSLVTFWNGAFNTTHSFLDLQVQASISGGASAFVSLLVNGVQAASQFTASASLAPITFSNIPVVGSSMKGLSSIQVSGNVFSGAGTLQVLVTYARLHGSLG